jgi:CRISPR/Cas system-associated endonuclease/helicase Cas3
MRISCDGETVYGLVETYKNKKNFVKRFKEKYPDLSLDKAIEKVMLKELKGADAPNRECGFYEMEDGDIPAYKGYLLPEL